MYPMPNVSYMTGCMSLPYASLNIVAAEGWEGQI